jgi:hypothetical protein
MPATAVTPGIWCACNTAGAYAIMPLPLLAGAVALDPESGIGFPARKIWASGNKLATASSTLCVRGSPSLSLCTPVINMLVVAP